MKSILKSDLIELLEKHRDNDVYVDFDGYEIPIKNVYYDSLSDQIRIRLDPYEARTVKMLIKAKPLKENLSDAK